MLTTKKKADIVKASLSMGDILNSFGFDGNARHGRIQCPLHAGDNHGSFSFNNKSFHCFACNAHGSQVSFVEQYLDVPFTVALDEINHRFGLWRDKNDDEKQSNKMTFADRRRLKRRIEQMELAKAIRERDERRMDEARLEYARLDANMIKYAPKSPDDDVDERYIEACHRTGIQGYILDCMEANNGQRG